MEILGVESGGAMVLSAEGAAGGRGEATRRFEDAPRFSAAAVPGAKWQAVWCCVVNSRLKVISTAQTKQCICVTTP